MKASDLQIHCWEFSCMQNSDENNKFAASKQVVWIIGVEQLRNR